VCGVDAAKRAILQFFTKKYHSKWTIHLNQPKNHHINVEDS